MLPRDHQTHFFLSLCLSLPLSHFPSLFVCLSHQRHQHRLYKYFLAGLWIDASGGQGNKEKEKTAAVFLPEPHATRKMAISSSCRSPASVSLSLSFSPFLPIATFLLSCARARQRDNETTPNMSFAIQRKDMASHCHKGAPNKDTKEIYIFAI